MEKNYKPTIYLNGFKHNNILLVKLYFKGNTIIYNLIQSHKEWIYYSNKYVNPPQKSSGL